MRKAPYEAQVVVSKPHLGTCYIECAKNFATKKEAKVWADEQTYAVKALGEIAIINTFVVKL